MTPAHIEREQGGGGMRGVEDWVDNMWMKANDEDPTDFQTRSLGFLLANQMKTHTIGSSPMKGLSRKLSTYQ